MLLVVTEPGERLDGDDSFGVEVHDRLVGDGQRRAVGLGGSVGAVVVGLVQGAAHDPLHPAALNGISAKITVEDLVAVFASVLGAVHRGVGVPQHLLRLASRVGEGQPDADRHDVLATVDVDFDRLGQGVPNALCHSQRVASNVGRLRAVVAGLEEHDELVAADARDRVLWSQHAAQPFAACGQDGIAGSVPAGVVDVLEPIEIAEQHRDVVPGAGAAGQRRSQPVGQQGPVG